MSIAVLNQVYDEARRLAVAGSVVARGDFRLKKLLPPLEQAGAKAPVFAKVAECAKAVIDGPEETSADSLLELTSLVTAVLYTQGETGVAGDLQPIETVDVGGTAAQTSARLLKPLLEALSSTGSGRWELVKDAHERGAFQDLRLVKPALDALDDPYGEIADFVAEKVLPLYGAAILPELRAKYDPKGTKGHPRRLKRMHALDPAGTRELVKQALEAGSKEVKVAAVACLGSDKEDLSFLIEQVGAKAADVRAAAYHALSRIDDQAAMGVLEKALAGKELELAAQAIKHGGCDSLTALLVTEIGKGRDALPKMKDKKQVSETARRLCKLIWLLPKGEHTAADRLTLDLFARRAELAKAKGEDVSGSDVNEAVVKRMAHQRQESLRVTLARAHADLNANELAHAVQGALFVLPPAEVYDLFSPYLLAAADRRKGKDAAEKKNAVIEMLGGDSVYRYRHRSERERSLDPRWLDLAVKIEHLGLVLAVGRPGHPGAEAFLQGEFESAFKKSGNSDQAREVVTVMVGLQHPRAASALLAAFEKTLGKTNAYTSWFTPLIPALPKSAIPDLEAVVTKLKGRDADVWLSAIQQLREKT
jgi:hypothetical protein